jgi:hypothetical protein
MLKLDRNIVSFSNTFVACDCFDDGNQVYFTFVNSKAETYLVNVLNGAKISLTKFNIDQRICSIKILGDHVVLGDETGSIYLTDLNLKTILKKFYTKSEMPILKIVTLNKRVILSTC